MANSTKFYWKQLRAIELLVIFLLGSIAAPGQALPAAKLGGTATFLVDGQIALHALMSLSDAHLQKLADDLALIAATNEVRSGQWEQVRGSLTQVATRNTAAVYWFALPDGTYWTLDSGRVTASLSSRPYFPRLMSGQTVMGELVVSRSTNRNTAIVAVPVKGKDNSIVGALGCSVHLDSLSALVRHEMGGLNDRLLFYSIDASPLVALNSNPELIFLEPLKQQDEGLQQSFRTILTNQQGVVSYTFRGKKRTVLYRKSPVTGWWYAFGMIR